MTNRATYVILLSVKQPTTTAKEFKMTFTNRPLVRAAFLTSSVTEIKEALSRLESNGGPGAMEVATHLREMLEECEAGGVENFGDLPL